MRMVLISALCSLLSCGREAPAQLPPASAGLHDQVAAMFADLEAGGVGTIAHVGDSIPTNPPWDVGLSECLWSQWGSAGWAYRGLDANFKWQGTATLTATFAGDVVKSVPKGNRDPVRGRDTPDGRFCLIATDGKITLTVPAGFAVRLHYSTAPGGGVLKVDRPNVAGIDFPAIPTDAPVRRDVRIDLPAGNPPNGGGSAKYVITSADGIAAQVNGVEVRDGTGFESARLGRGSNGPADYNTGDTASTAEVLRQINPDIVVYMQDWFVPTQSIASFRQQTRDYIAFIRATLDDGAEPPTGIILIAHHAMIDDSAQVSQVLYELSQELGCGFIDNRQLATYEENVGLGRLAPDGKHLSTAGGKYFAEEDVRLMREAWGK